MSTVFDRFLPVHTRYTTKEEERQKQDAHDSKKKLKVGRAVDVEVNGSSTARCGGEKCNNSSLYNADFDDSMFEIHG